MPTRRSRRRISRAEADARIAHIPPAEQERLLDDALAQWRAFGIDVSLFTDATGRSFVAIPFEQVRARLGDAVANALQAVCDDGPQPEDFQPPTG